MVNVRNKLASAILALAGVGIVQGSAAGQEFVVEIRQIDDRKAVLARVDSIDTTVARARIGGTVRGLGVDEGDRTTAGQRVAAIEDQKLPQRLAALDAQIGSLKAEESFAVIDLDRAKKLRTTGTGTQARLDQARTNVATLRGRLAAMRAERGVVAEQIVEAEVLAPATGRVLRVHVTDGRVVLPGEPIATIALDTFILRLELPERHARFLKTGDQVTVGPRGLADSAGALTEGTIRQVYPELRDGRVIADAVAPALGNFFVGERVRVYVSTGKRRTILIPARYVTSRFGLAFVRLKNQGDVVVQTGQRHGDDVEILSGLRPGDVLVPP